MAHIDNLAEVACEFLQKYIGTPVEMEVIESSYDWEVDGDTKKVPIKLHGLKNSPVIEEIENYLKQKKQEQGIAYRILVPGGLMTADYRLDRVNVSIKETFKNSGLFHINSVYIG